MGKIFWSEIKTTKGERNMFYMNQKSPAISGPGNLNTGMPKNVQVDSAILSTLGKLGINNVTAKSFPGIAGPTTSYTFDKNNNAGVKSVEILQAGDIFASAIVGITFGKADQAAKAEKTLTAAGYTVAVDASGTKLTVSKSTGLNKELDAIIKKGKEKPATQNPGSEIFDPKDHIDPPASENGGAIFEQPIKKQKSLPDVDLSKIDINKLLGAPGEKSRGEIKFDPKSLEKLKDGEVPNPMKGESRKKPDIMLN